jgi:hypothetical protein
VPEQELYGTMRPHAGAGVVLEIPGGAGTLTLRREGSRLEIEAGLVAGQAGSADEIRLRGEGLAARLYEPEPASATRLEVGPREVVLARLDGGRHRLTVEVEDAGSPLELLVSARARPILQREFRLNDL